MVTVLIMRTATISSLIVLLPTKNLTPPKSKSDHESQSLSHIPHCSGQNPTTLQDHDTCPTISGVSQVDNELEILVASHSTPRRTSWALPRVHIQPRGEDLRPYPDITLNPEERDLRPYPDFTFKPKERTSGPFFLSLCLHVLCFPITVEAVIDSDRYLDMSIPTIKHSNLNNYEKISTSKSCGYGDSWNKRHQLRLYKVLKYLEI